jgi:hypothetical protein
MPIDPSPPSSSVTSPRGRRAVLAVLVLVVALVAPLLGPTAAHAAGTVPAAPRGVVATPGTGQASISWTPPAYDGGSALTGYAVTASPGGATCTTSVPTTACTVPGLTNGTAYTFMVRAQNANGASLPSSPSGAVAPDVPGSGYTSLVPVRVLDSRGALGGWASTALGTTAKTVKVTGPLTTIPDTAVAVVMNVTATQGSVGSFLTVYPAGTNKPVASNLNFGPNETIPNLVTVRIGSGGAVAFANSLGTVHVIADVVGYYAAAGSAGDSFFGINPSRLLDSRTSTAPPWTGALPPGAANARALHVVGVGGVPGSATTVVLNVTSTGSSAPSFLQVWPTGSPQPAQGSNLNFAPGQTIPNLVVVKVGTGGNVSFFNAAGSTHVIVDVVGYFDPQAGGRFHAMNPTRFLDDRVPNGLIGPWKPGQTRSLGIGGRAGVSEAAIGVVMNTTATGGTAGSFLTVFPDNVKRPNSSNLNFAPGQTIPNLVMVRVAANRKISIYNALGNVDVIGDVVGYFTSFRPGSMSCESTPANSFWRADVTGLSVHGSSGTWIATAGAGKGLKADFGSGLWDGGPIGIPFDVVDAQTTKSAVSFDYADESDPGGYPIPGVPSIEGGPQSGGDRHVLMIDKDACKLYELYSAYPNANGTWSAGSGIIMDMRSNAMRPEGWTSADAAGLQIMPGLVQYDEVASGVVQHAIRMTVPATQNAHVWPASHTAGSGGASVMPMGTWLRLKASVNELAFDPAVRPIIVALKTHGAVIADNGSAWYMSGVPDERWDNDKLATLGQIKGSDFEVVDASPLKVANGSYEATTAH